MIRDEQLRYLRRLWLDDISANTPTVPVPTYAHAYHTTGGTTAITTPKTLVLGTLGENSGNWTLSSNELACDQDGKYLVTVDVYLNNSGTSRTEAQIWLEVDTGSGYSEVTSSRSAIYLRGYDSGTSASITKILDVSSGDSFRLRANRTDGGGSPYQDDNGTRLSFVELV